MDAPPDWQHWFDAHAAALVLLARQWCVDQADAEDAVQEAFIRAWRNRATIRDVGAYLFAATKSAALDRHRRERRLKQRELAMSTATHTRLLTSPMEHDERRAAVEAALGTLPGEQREVLVMKVWGQLTFAQIAEALQIPANTAASRYRYALQSLRQQLSEEHV